MLAKKEEFTTQFGYAPDLQAVAPGRVNLIGEHIDHQNFSVLPCALKTRMIEIFKGTDSSARDFILKIAHKKENQFPEITFTRFEDIKVSSTHAWSNYVIASYLGVCEFLVHSDPMKVGLIDAKKGLPHDMIKELEGSCVDKQVTLWVDGNVPPAAGLSSSSAIVVACARALIPDLPPSDIATICANSERHVGTAGGGMDQAAICLSEENKAQHIGFNPLVCEPIELPPELAIVIANSGREAPKARDAAKMYNKRVFELKTACFYFIKQHNPPKAANLSGQDVLSLNLRDVLQNDLQMSPSDALQQLEHLLSKQVYTKEKIDDILPTTIRDYLLTKRCGPEVWSKNSEFFLFERVRHVLSETLRVEKFVDICKKTINPDKPTPDEVLKELGVLINESHYSLRDDFDASCAELDELTGLARNSGALGSRLTGAGWGGCTVSLVKKSDVHSFVEKVICAV